MNTAKRPRILHITRNLPPLVGGMERLNWHIADELSRHADVHVIGPQGAAALKPESVHLTEVPLRPLWRFLLASVKQASTTARRIRPDIVLAGSGLTAPAALLAARVSKARAAVYVHGLDVAVHHPVYRALWHPAIRHMDTVIANSHPTAELVRELGVEPDRIKIVHPGVTLPTAPQPPEALQAFRQCHGLGDARLLLSIGRLTTRKGLHEFVQHALPGIVRQAQDTLLVVIGDTPANALHADIQAPESIRAIATEAGIGDHVRFLGGVSDVELACAYESAAVHVFPVRHIPGDPEGFGMVAIEAAAHGLPSVAFATGGVVDAISEGRSGRLIPPGDYVGMVDAICRILIEGDAWAGGCLEFAQGFAWAGFGKSIAQQLNQSGFHGGMG